MTGRINRREFVAGGAVAAMAAASGKPISGQAPAVKTGSVRPVVIASANGNRLKNGGTQTCVEKAFSMITGGSDVLDALIAGVNIVELEPDQTGVGWAVCRTPTASSSSTPPACTGRRSGPARSPAFTACGRHRSWPER